jgi:alanine-glyoxylate transaminase/serine-glyoxylate transaminase/serine-pyruvate transaminase
MGKRLVAHYGKGWVEIFYETRDLVQRVFRTENEVYLIPGTGTTGLEMGIRSCFCEGDKVLVVINGTFSSNLAKFARLNGVEVERLELTWGEPVPLEEVEKALDRSAATGIICTHVETMLGVRNPVREIGEMARRKGVVFLLDAVSSLGGEEVAVDDWGLDICVTATQKCLGIPPGLALVSVSEKAWKAMETRKEANRGWYFDLLQWRKVTKELADWHPHPATLPVSLVLALRESLEQIFEEGLENVLERHKEVAGFVRRGLGNLGFRVVPDEYAANTVTTAYTPAGIEPEEIIDFLLERFNIQISKFLGKNAPKAIRVGHMGPAACMRAALPVLMGVQEFMQGKGFEVDWTGGSPEAKRIAHSGGTLKPAAVGSSTSPCEGGESPNLQPSMGAEKV